MRFSDALKLVLDKPLPGHGRVSLHLADAKTVLLTVTPGDDFEPAVSYAVVRRQWPEFEYSCQYPDENRAVVKTDEIDIELTIEPFHLRVRDRAGIVRFETSEKALRFAGSETVLSRKLQAGEGVYGLGEHGENFNRNPGQYRAWNKDIFFHHPLKEFYCVIPAAICAPTGAAMPHGFLLDNPGETRFDIGMPDSEAMRLSSGTGDFRLWLFFGDTPAELLEQYTSLTGRMQRPPLWALGFQQCRWSYMSAEVLGEVARNYRQRRIPCDVLYFDIDYMHRYRVFTWNDDAFPDAKSFIGELKDLGFDTVTIVDPGVAKIEEEADYERRASRGWPRPETLDRYRPYEEGMAKKGFFLHGSDGKLITATVWPGKVHMPDFTSAENRALWGEWQEEALLDMGISGIWNDMNEPAIFPEGGGFCPDFPADAVHYDFGLFRTHRRIHNVYGMTMAQASSEGQVRSRPDARPFTLTRSGWAGVQRYSAVWTGDNQSTFASMVLDLQNNLSMGMAGAPFVGCDIGGFAGNAGAELMVRWYEWGVFQPFCRAHSAWDTHDHEPWARGATAEKLIRRLIELRYQLLPYIYTQFVVASETGLPVNRPLVLEYPHDATLTSIGDEFLLGPDLLVAPILRMGDQARAVYLPAGEWIHFWTGNRLNGGQWVLAQSQLGKGPLYVRAGAVVPMHPVRQHTKEPEPEVTFLDIWPGARLSGLLIEDDGATHAYRNGAECRTAFSGTEDAKELVLKISAPAGPYRGARKRWEVRLHRDDRAIGAVLYNGRGVDFEKDGNLIRFSFPAEEKAIEIRVRYS